MSMNVDRRGFLTTAAAAAIVTSFSIRKASAAPQYSFKYGANVPATHPLVARMQEAADAISKESDGRFQLNIFPNNQLGGDSDMLSQIRSGGLEFFSVSGVSALSTLIPQGAIYGVGFAWPDYNTVWRAMDGELGTYLRRQITNAGLIVMDKIWDSGFRQITTRTRAIEKPADLASLKIRVPVSALWTSLFEGLGASPSSINLAEVYSALQTSIVDGEENSLVIISTNKFYEVQKHCAITNHMWDGYWLIGNRRAWSGLPDDLKDIVSRNFNAAAVRQRQDVERLNSQLATDLAGMGLQFTKPDRAAFQDKLRQSGFYTNWKAKFGDEGWDLLEKAVGKLA
jgi:tripartite ATP-independent transporter DctP family solute receptor